jgi:tetratricopeptide (TPR) repeat protein
MMTLVNLAQLKIRQGHYGEADRLYADVTAASEGNPTVYDPLVLRGRARLKVLQGNRSGAESLWSQAETLLRQSFVGANASSFGHRRDLARLLLERGRTEDVGEAVSLMQNEIKLRRDADTLDTYAWALSQAGQQQAAQKVIQAAIAQGIRSAGIFDRAGAIDRALGNMAQANIDAQIVHQIDPKFDNSARQALGLGSGLGSW